MTQAMFGTIATLMCVGALMGSPQEPAQSPEAPPSQASAATGPLAKLRADLTRALKNATLSESQKKTLQDAGTRLREAAQARQEGGKVDRKSVKKALDQIRKVAESGAFQPDDAAAVKADLDAMREAGGRSRRRGFRR